MNVRHQITNIKRDRRRLIAMSAILGMFIGLGITAAVGGGLYFAFQEQVDLFSTSSQIEVKNLNAIKVGDTLTITANVKNVGSAAISNVQIQEISTGDNFELVRTGETKATAAATSTTGFQYSGKIGANTGTLLIGTDGKSYGDASSNASTLDGRTVLASTATATTGPKIELQGFKSIDGGSSTALRMKITQETGTPAESIRGTVQVSERMTFQIFYQSGQDEFVSDVYNTRVRPG